MFSKFIKCAVLAFLLSLFTACSDSGSSNDGISEASKGSPDNEEPTLGQPQGVTLSFEAVKRFRFDWTDIEGATHYQLLENPDGASGFSPVGASVEQGVQTLILEVPLYTRTNAQYILQACNGEGVQEICNDSETLSVSGTLADSIGYFKASNTNAYDLFGWALSLSGDGNTLAVGASREASSSTGINGDQGNNDARSAGAVYIFSRDDGAWNQQAYLKASNTDVDDNFGGRLSLSADGNTLAVGTYKESSSATGIDGDQSSNDAHFAGAVYLFSRTEGTWAQQAYVKASNTEASDYFGSSLSLSEDGNTLAVGAAGESSSATGIDGGQSNNDAPGAGAVYIFNRSEATWAQQTYIKASNTEAGDQFGWDLSLSADGNTLAVQATDESSSASGINGNQKNNDAPRAGAVYIFSRSEDSWVQQAYVKASNANEGDLFGRPSLSGDGNTLAVGASHESSSATGINGDQNNNSSGEAGAVYVFFRSDNTWSQQAYIKASNTNEGDLFGLALSLSEDGNTLAVGASNEFSNAKGVGGDQNNNSANDAGAVYVFLRNQSSWAQRAYVKASNTGARDYFGSPGLSLSGDGNTLAVGAADEDSSATGINGDQSNNDTEYAGAVYVY
ncbi:histidine kinase [uncultured Microbulbifer sp.]|uniref:histidine kinase n=1 Tax=uncultured Microbulbifer sp. TaxID=348147 RepID=UPI00262826C8|nr:histidine kinase [uncultured Microbulbifer sp.]